MYTAYGAEADVDVPKGEERVVGYGGGTRCTSCPASSPPVSAVVLATSVAVNETHLFRPLSPSDFRFVSAFTDKEHLFSAPENAISSVPFHGGGGGGTLVVLLVSWCGARASDKGGALSGWGLSSTSSFEASTKEKEGEDFIF